MELPFTCYNWQFILRVSLLSIHTIHPGAAHLDSFHRLNCFLKNGNEKLAVANSEQSSNLKWEKESKLFRSNLRLKRSWNSVSTHVAFKHTLWFLEELCSWLSWQTVLDCTHVSFQINSYIDIRQQPSTQTNRYTRVSSFSSKYRNSVGSPVTFPISKWASHVLPFNSLIHSCFLLPTNSKSY